MTSVTKCQHKHNVNCLKPLIKGNKTPSKYLFIFSDQQNDRVLDEWIIWPSGLFQSGLRFYCPFNSKKHSKLRQGVIAHSFSLSPSHCPDMTDLLLTKISSHLSIHSTVSWMGNYDRLYAVEPSLSQKEFHLRQNLNLHY